MSAHAYCGGVAINSIKQALHLAVAAAEYYPPPFGSAHKQQGFHIGSSPSRAGPRQRNDYCIRWVEHLNLKR